MELWTEKYRPKKIEDYVFKDKRQEELVKSWIQDNSLPHCLLFGPAGTGKSSLISVLKHNLDLDSGDILEINASEETSIDVVRTKILTFVQTVAFGDFKLAILEECLHEDEYIQTPTGSIRLGDLHIEETLDVLSLNMETGEIEPDTAEVIIDREQEVYEVELEDGRTIRTTLNHPFLVHDLDGNIQQRELQNLKEGDKIIA